MKNNGNKHYIDILFVLLIFASFMITALLLISLGTNEYRRIVQRMGDNDNLRTASAYLTQKVRHCKGDDGIEISSLEGTQALKLYETIGGADYVTWIYASEGQMCEQFTSASNPDVKLSGGTQIFPLESLEFDYTDETEDALIVRISFEDGAADTLVLKTVP